MENNQGINKIKYEIDSRSFEYLKHLDLFYFIISEIFKLLDNSDVSILKNTSFNVEGYLDYNKEDFPKIINQIKKIMVIGLYHKWEKDVKDILLSKTNNIDIQNAIKNIGFNGIQNLFRTSKDYKQSFSHLFAALEKYSNLINAIKHGDGRSRDKLYNTSPEFFAIGHNGKKNIDDIIISDELFSNLYETLVQFWQANPCEAVIDCEILKTK